MTPTKPYELVRALQAYDPSLRLRWGTHSELWMIEKELPARHIQLLREHSNPTKSKRGRDIHEGLKAGYVNVLNVHPSLADNVSLVMARVTEADTWRQGGLAALNRKLDELDAEWERAGDRTIDNYNEAAASDMHDRIQWLSGNRVAVTDPPREAPGEQKDGFILRDRRVTA